MQAIEISPMGGAEATPTPSHEGEMIKKMAMGHRPVQPNIRTVARPMASSARQLHTLTSKPKVNNRGSYHSETHLKEDRE